MILYNGLTLAYIGDAYYELRVRKHLLDKQIVKVNNLHNEAILYTQAKSQADVAQYLVENHLTENEIDIYKRGRNQTSTHKPKNADIQTYNMATGFEALIGYLYLSDKQERLETIIKYALAYVEENRSE